MAQMFGDKTQVLLEGSYFIVTDGGRGDVCVTLLGSSPRTYMSATELRDALTRFIDNGFKVDPPDTTLRYVDLEVLEKKAIEILTELKARFQTLEGAR